MQEDPVKVKLKIKFSGFEQERGEVEIDNNKTYSQVLEEMGINPETAVVIKGGLPIPSDELVEEGTVRIIRVISGG